MATQLQQRRISGLERRNKELKEVSRIHEEKPIASLLPGLKTEFKEERLTLLGAQPYVLVTVKEIKEEAVPMTKAETTSAQPTTGMSDISLYHCNS
jgi:hypothetical protein